MTAIEQDGMIGRLERLLVLRYEAEALRQEYRAVFRNRDISHAERHASVEILTEEMNAILMEARLLVYSIPGINHPA